MMPSVLTALRKLDVDVEESFHGVRGGDVPGDWRRPLQFQRV